MPVVYSADGDPAAPAAGGGSKLGPVAAILLVVIAAGLVGWRVVSARQAAPAPVETAGGPGPGMAPGGGPAGQPGGQPGQGGPGGGQRQGLIERMAEQLDLTENQKAQAAKLQEEAGPKMAAVREDASLSDEQRREKLREIGQEQQAAFAKILTPEQQKKLEELQAQGGGSGGQGGGPGGQGGGRQSWTARLASELKLTPEQQPKWDKVREGYDAKRQALRDDTALSDDDRRAKMGELREQQNEELKKLLTPEQQKKMDELIAERARNFGGGGQGGGPGGGQGGGGGGPADKGGQGGGGGGGGQGGGGEQAAPKPAPSQT